MKIAPSRAYGWKTRRERILEKRRTLSNIVYQVERILILSKQRVRASDWKACTPDIATNIIKCHRTSPNFVATHVITFLQRKIRIGRQGVHPPNQTRDQNHVQGLNVKKMSMHYRRVDNKRTKLFRKYHATYLR